MMIDLYPTPAELIANEMTTLDLIVGNTHFASHHGKFVADADGSLKQNRNRQGFRFESYIEVAHTEMPGSKTIDPATGSRRRNLRIHIGSVIAQKGDDKFDNISYYLMVAKLRGKLLPTIVRKFHFDVTPTRGINRRQAHPVFHIQYCGKLTPWMVSEFGYDQTHLNHMHHGLSEPRIFAPPISLALLVDLALREFASLESTVFLRDSEWKRKLRDDEKLVLSKFHKKCSSLIDSNSKATLSDFFYTDN